MRSRAAAFLVLAISLLPVAGLFTLRQVFFVRDLSFFFWSRHLWLRHTVFAGNAPWWDPHVAGGQSAIADALHQLLMPVTLAIRLLPSDVLSFNLWVALPLPIAGIGTWLFLRRTLPESAAALGGCVFAACGPMVSSLNAPNLAWSVALIPWVMWSAGAGSSIAAAIAFALQALCGEPATWVATGVLAFCYVLFQLDGETTRRKIAAVLGLFAGAGLAAAQLVPTVLAGIRAERAAAATPDFWSLHPVALWEMIAPHLFGNFFRATLADLPWMGALNFGRDPFFYSLYIGPVVLLLAAVGAGARRRTVLWAVVAGVSLVAALGGYTPVYRWLRSVSPELLYFRFPAKYIVFTMFAMAVLAAHGWAAIADLPPEGGSHEVRRGRSHDVRPAARRSIISWLPVAAGSLCLLISIAALAWPDLVLRAAHALALDTHLRDPVAGAAFLARSAPPLALRASVLLLAAGLVARMSTRRYAASLLFAIACGDLVIANRDLNPTIAADRLSPPAWYVASALSERLYVGGRVRGFMNTDDPDATPASQVPKDVQAIERRAELDAELPLAPSGWGVREALSYDLPRLWPAAYEATVRQFEQAPPASRRAFLRRSAVRRCVLPAARQSEDPAVAEVPDWAMRVVDCQPTAARAYLASSSEVASDPADPAWQRAVLFDPNAADDVVRLDRLPPVTGLASAPLPPSVRFVEDGTTRVVLEATLDRAGILVLRDSYDDSWSAEVDGAPAQIARANGLYRAVSLAAGRHVIRFAYRPRDLAIGLIISGATLLMLLLAGRFARLGRSRRDEGFTLIELMVVLAIIAILLAIAFNEYRGMQARGNETSALTSMRSIAAAQWQFALTCGNMHYATKLPDLATPVPRTGEGFLSPDLTSAETFEKSGYVLQMAAKPLDDVKPACNGVPVAAGYAATADPAKPGVSGNVFYGVNADRILYIDEDKTFTKTMPESGAPDHGTEVKK